MKRTLDHGVKLGFTFAGVVCGNAYSNRIFEKLKFEKVKSPMHKAVISYVTV